MDIAVPDHDEQPGAGIAWHAVPTGEAIAALGSHHTGLGAEEAERRLARHGPNRLPETPPRHPLLRFLAQFHNTLIYVLLGAAVVTAGIGHFIDSAVILGVVVINAIVGFIQEGKAESALGAIRAMLSPHASVLRDGERLTIDATALVPGDVVLLEAGDRVPADLRLVHAKGLEIDEAALTGESVPVGKHAEPAPADAMLAERGSMAYSSSLVTRGTGSGLVVATGTHTEVGRIGRLIAGVVAISTPLIAQMDRFGRWLTVVILAAAAAIFAFGVLVRSYSASEMFLAAVGLAVAAIPEGLPAILTITLALGVERMARRKAIVRHLPAVETLGSVTVICSDKTGTLTRNEMTVEQVATSDTVFLIGGTGYAPQGEVRLAEGMPDEARRRQLQELARAACLCSDARVHHHEGEWRVEGDPMEGAIVVLARKAGIDPQSDCASQPRIDVLPFDTTRRLMASLHRDGGGGGHIHVKGAPELLIELCDRQAGPSGEAPIDLSWWHVRLEGMAAAGQRVLAVATRRVAQTKCELAEEDIEQGLTMLGLLGIADPPRQEALEAVAACRSAGIRVKMITGDHAATARAIAARFGLATHEVVTGRDFDVMGPGDLIARAQSVDVFARTSPEHKLRLVEALQEAGEVVAMTGDGVNDAPALKRADIGIAMGIKGSEAAKEAAQVVLADDNFATIARAVEEGRTIYENLKKSIVFMLPTNGGEAFTLIVAILAGIALPVTPLQILWVNMITTVTLALALAFEPGEADIMARPPRRPDEPILSGFLVWRIAFVSLLMTGGVFALFLSALDNGDSLDHARTIAVNALVAFEAAYLLNSRHLTESVMSREGLLGSWQVLAAIALVAVFQAALTYLPPLQELFGTAALDAADWALIGAAALALFVIVEIEKWATRRYRRAWQHRPAGG